MWLTDDTNELVQIGFSPSGVCLLEGIETRAKVPMDTTTAFHVYRISRQRKRVTVYVDGTLVIDQDLVAPGETNRVLIFGDGMSGGGATRSYWDYFTYDVSGPSP